MMKNTGIACIAIPIIASVFMILEFCCKRKIYNNLTFYSMQKPYPSYKKLAHINKVGSLLFREKNGEYNKG